jgi:hypothetical protein
MRICGVSEATVKLNSVGQVIASRSIRKDGSTDVAYVVDIGLPQQFPDSTNYYCPIQVTGKPQGKETILYSAGIDSVQALQLAMILIGGILFRLNEEAGGSLRWEGDEKGDLGFPVPT